MRAPISVVAVLAGGLVACATGGAAPVSRPGGEAGDAPARPPALRHAPAATGTAGSELGVMRQELERALSELAKTPDGSPYFLAYQLSTSERASVYASFGALVSSDRQTTRSLDLDLRMGSHALDNTHPLRGRRVRSAGRFPTLGAGPPLSGDAEALRAALWMETREHYDDAVERLAQIRAERKVRADEEDRSGDFSPAEPLEHIEPAQGLALDSDAWEQRLRRLSALLTGYDELYRSGVSLEAEALTRHFVSSEGSRVQTSSLHVRLRIDASTTAGDGMRLSLYDVFSAFSIDDLPSDEQLERSVRALADQLMALRNAPVGEPYAGPAIIEGDAAAVFFHEVFGHRVEGHRQKDEDEGQTFAKKVGKPIMPDFIDIYDDPSAQSLDGTALMGHYRVDDEGVRAQRTQLVDDGVFRTFLMSRTPTRDFNASNGHGRRQAGYPVVARQGNLIIEPSRAVTREQLRARLLAEVAKADKPYGLIVRRVHGGFTATGRQGPQAFKVHPLLVYRLYPDGREELVRGLDLEGTPLTVLSKIGAAGDDYAVFNGTCGAESGWVPVAAASPSLLLSQLEVARQEKGDDRPPLLPAPPRGGAP